MVPQVWTENKQVALPTIGLLGIPSPAGGGGQINLPNNNSTPFNARNDMLGGDLLAKPGA